MRNFKERKSIDDLEIDKESLMQLNRATGQFFAQKVKETILINHSPYTTNNKNYNKKYSTCEHNFNSG